MTTAADMPKIHSPFVRREINRAYVVTPEITPGYEWVFEDPSVSATEKLHGTNVSIVVEKGEIVSVYNRTARIPFFCRGKSFITEGLLESHRRGWCDLPDGQHFGELVGPKLHDDPHEVGRHLWVPFSTYARGKLVYKSPGLPLSTWLRETQPLGGVLSTFAAISQWFEDGLFSLFATRIHKEPPNPQRFVEGVVFVRPATGQMAKLRRDMFPWFVGSRHKEARNA